MAYTLQPADMRAKWEAYCRQCDTNVETVRYRGTLMQVPKKVIYSVEGFCLFSFIGEDELKAYENNKNYRVLFKNIRYWVLCRKMQALVNGEGSVTGLIFDLKCNYGLCPTKVAEKKDWRVTMDLGDRIEEITWIDGEEVSRSVRQKVSGEEEDEVIKSRGQEVIGQEVIKEEGAENPETRGFGGKTESREEETDSWEPRSLGGKVGSEEAAGGEDVLCMENKVLQHVDMQGQELDVGVLPEESTR